MPDAFIHDAIRSPRGKGRPDGTLHEVTADSLSARMLDVLAARNRRAAQMPAFDRVALMKYPHLERIDRIHHAGNSNGIVDGAELLIGDTGSGRDHGLRPRARIRATAKIGTDPTIMLTVPVTGNILREAGMTITGIDLFEVHETFAAVVLRFQQAFGVDPARVNPCGGSAIIIGTLLDALERSGKATGLATLCTASGVGPQPSSSVYDAEA